MELTENQTSDDVLQNVNTAHVKLSYHMTMKGLVYLVVTR